MIIRKSSEEIELMARAGAVVAGTLALIEERLEPGISMAELDRLAEEYIRSHDGVIAMTLVLEGSLEQTDGSGGRWRLEQGDGLESRQRHRLRFQIDHVDRAGVQRAVHGTFQRPGSPGGVPGGGDD